MPELDGNIAPLSNFCGIIERLLCIWKKRAHFIFRLDVELPAWITHTILILHLFTGLEAKKNVVWFCIFGKRIVNIICGYHRNAGLLMKAEDAGIDFLLLGVAVILKFQKEIVLPENILIMKGSFFASS